MNGQFVTIRFAPVRKKAPEGDIALVEDFLGANSQAGTPDETRTNMREAVPLILETNRSLAEKSSRGRHGFRGTFTSLHETSVSDSPRSRRTDVKDASDYSRDEIFRNQAKTAFRCHWSRSIRRGGIPSTASLWRKGLEM